MDIALLGYLRKGLFIVGQVICGQWGGLAVLKKCLKWIYDLAQGQNHALLYFALLYFTLFTVAVCLGPL